MAGTVRLDLEVEMRSLSDIRRIRDAMLSSYLDPSRWSEIDRHSEVLVKDVMGIGPEDMELGKAIRVMLTVATQGDLYALRGDARKLVLSAARTLPREGAFRGSMLRSDCGTLFLDSGPLVNPQVMDNASEPRRLAGISWYYAGENLAGFSYLGDGRDRGLASLPSGAFRIHAGVSWGDFVDQAGDDSESLGFPEPAAIFLSLLLFIEQRVLVATVDHGARQERRKAERDGVLAPNVTVITLRSVEHSVVSGEGTPLSYRHLRRGHWSHRWIKDQHPDFDHSGPCPQLVPRWLVPTIVGDPSLPFRPPGERVFDVRR